MCCFARSVESVESTRIFARLSDTDRQYLVYQMQYESKVPNAMILPLPTPPRSGEDAINFIDMSQYKSFFKDMRSGFPLPAPARTGSIDSKRVPTRSALKVHRVGSFDASFVPSVDDFGRLDQRFVIPEEVWTKLPQYSDWGFAVLQLHELAGEPEPIAFDFRTRDSAKVFFPTVHIHDGQVHAEEQFHHTLYLQSAAFGEKSGEKRRARSLFGRSYATADEFIDIPKTNGIVDGNLHVYQKRMYGKLANQDVWIATGKAKPQSNSGILKRLLPLGVFIPLGLLIRRRQKLRQQASSAKPTD